MKILKKYGRSILIKAGNSTQAMLLSKFKTPEHGNINRVTPHKTFNTCRGIIFSEDLYDFSEAEILDMCPGNVYEVRKLRGNNHTILLSFSSTSLPDTIFISHSRFFGQEIQAKTNSMLQLL